MNDVDVLIYSIFSLVCIIFGLATIGCLVLYIISKFRHNENEEAFKCSTFICLVICAVSAFAVIATTPKCNICNASLKVDDKFCRACGVSVDTAKPECPDCSTQLEPNDKFCYNCGKSTERNTNE